MRTWLFIALLISQSGTLSAQVSGRVYDAQSNGTVHGALLEITGSAGRRSTYSTTEGLYSFNALPPGEACLRVVHPGYETTSVCLVVNGHPLMLDLPVRPRPLVLSTIEVVGVRTGALDPGRIADNSGSGATGQPVGVPAVVVPGAATNGVLTSLGAANPGQPGRPRAHTLHIWSAGADKGVVALDGAVLSAPLHLGALLPPLDPELLGSAISRAGGAAARHDGGAAQLLELSTRPANRGSRMWLAADLLSIRAGAEVATADAGLNAAVRRVNNEIIDGSLAQPFGYAYHDGLARADVRLGDRIALRATAFATEEQLRIPRDQGHDYALWSNGAVSAGAHMRGRNADYNAEASFSRGRAELPVLSVLGGHQAATLDRLSLAASTVVGVPAFPFSAGIVLDHFTFRRAFRSTGGGEDAEPPLACDTSAHCATQESVGAAHADVSLPHLGSLSVRVGVRIRYTLAEGRTDVLPRLLLSHPLGAGVVTLGAGDFTQSMLADADGTVRLITARARHVELGVVQQFEGTLLRAVVHARRGAAAADDEVSGHVPGVDVGVIRRVPFGTVSANYGIERLRAGTTGSLTYRRTAALGLELRGSGLRGELGASYAAGFPATSIVLERPEEFLGFHAQHGPPTSQAASDRSYLRVDASAGAQWRFQVGDRSTTVMPYVRVLNTFDDRESVFYYRERDGTSRALARLPVLPVLGVRLEF